MALLICLFSINIIALADDNVPTQLDVSNILEQSTTRVTDDGIAFQMIVIPEEELQTYIDAYTRSQDGIGTRNILPNLVIFSYTSTTNSVTMKVTNIAIDRLNVCRGC